MWNFFSLRRFYRFVCQFRTIVFIKYIDLIELRETIKAFSTGTTWNWQRMNNSTRAVWAPERLYSFSLSHPASGSILVARDLWELTPRILRYFENYTFSNVNWNVSFILLCCKEWKVIEIYKARNPMF